MLPSWFLQALGSLSWPALGLDYSGVEWLVQFTPSLERPGANGGGGEAWLPPNPGLATPTPPTPLWQRLPLPCQAGPAVALPINSREIPRGPVNGADILPPPD